MQVHFSIGKFRYFEISLFIGDATRNGVLVGFAQFQQYTQYYMRLIEKSIEQASNMGSNFLPINHYFALPALSAPTPNNDITKIDVLTTLL